jgi:hypothetical protein
MLAKEVEGDVSITLLSWLQKNNIIDLLNRTIKIDREKFSLLINNLLQDIYQYEQLAHDKQAFDQTSLKFAAFFRKKHITIHPTVIEFLNRYSVQDCKYTINFMS